MNKIKKANMYLSNKKYQEALNLYEKIILANPKLEKVLIYNINICKKNLGLSTDKNSVNITVFKGRQEKNILNNKLEEEVFIGIAAIPERVDALKIVIQSLLHQASKIGVYLNGWKEIPSFLLNDKILIAGFNSKDLGDRGKFFWVDSHKGIYFTCDDDLQYPSDYVAKTVERLKHYQYKAVVGWHGSVLKTPFHNYYDTNSRRVFVFSAHRPYDTSVHILGTGCSAFHTQMFPIKSSDFIHPNMADIFFSLKGQEWKIPFYVIKHEKNEITEIAGNKESSIFSHSHSKVDSKKNTAELQNEFVRKFGTWTLNHFTPMSILIIGRFESYSKGGIYKSCHLIQSSLSKLGHSVSTLDSNNKLEIGDSDHYDLCWIYPGDPERPDFDTINEKILELQKKKIPVLVNLSYIYLKSRTEWIAKKLKQYNINKDSPVFAAVFTETAANDPILEDVIEFVSVVPKTLQPTVCENYFSFDEREGICLGDATKLGNSKIIGGSINPWIDAIANRLPHVNLYAYKQYQGKNPHPKVKYVPHMKEEFGEWLAKRKLFVCANVHLTFEMVICEAQQYGTPSIYRHMPHSLSEYISATGLAVRTPDEMAEMVAWLYNDRVAWSNLSKSSVDNANSKNIELLSSSLEGYLRLTIHRANRIVAKWAENV